MYATTPLNIMLLLATLFTSNASSTEPYIKMQDPTEAFSMVKPYLPNNPVILEAGAYDGHESITMSRLWPQGTLYTFEPTPELYRKLLTTVRPHPNIYAFPFALSDKKGTATFHISSYDYAPGAASQSSSLLAPKEHVTYAPFVLFQNQVTVFTTTIDEWAKDFGIDHIDLMWLDMQGAELQALKASPNILKTVKAILTEVEVVEAYKGQPLFAEVKQWLESQGFSMIATTLDLKNPNWFGDALFVRTR